MDRVHLQPAVVLLLSMLLSNAFLNVADTINRTLEIIDSLVSMDAMRGSNLASASISHQSESAIQVFFLVLHSFLIVAFPESDSYFVF